MPVIPTYPGVYIEELPSGVRTLVGVATSITAFIGPTRRGPVNSPTRVQSFGEFERHFGGLSMDSPLSFAVRHFFQNGGADALVVRVVDTEGGAATATLGEGANAWRFAAFEPGAAGNRLRLTVANNGAANFDFTIERLDENGAVVQSQPFTDVAPDDLADELETGNGLVRVVGTSPATRPAPVTAFALEGGVERATAATLDLASDAPGTVDLPLQGGGTVRLVSVDRGARANQLRVTTANNGANNFDLTLTRLNSDGTVNGTPEVYSDVAPANLVTTLAASPLARVQGAAPGARPTPGANRPFAVADALTLEAANVGAWGNDLYALVDHDTSEAGLFNLTVRHIVEEKLLASESHRNLSTDPTHRRFVATVLAAESALARVRGAVPATRPGESLEEGPEGREVMVPAAATGGTDGLPPSDAAFAGNAAQRTGLYALDQADLFNMLCIPPATFDGETNDAVWSEAHAYCRARRAMLIVDPPANWTTAAQAVAGVDALRTTLGASFAINAALYFPRLLMANPLRENRIESFVPCGAVAGVIARTDAARGIWKAPAGTEASLAGVRELTYKMTDGENGQLNPLAVNCLRTFPVYGNVVWGARTLAGADRIASEWKYLPVRRLALFIEESLYRGTQWVVFEPNDEPLWSQIRLNVGAFMHDLFRKGAFQGTSPRDAYFVKCDRETTTQSDINQGIVNILVGFAPLKPAEFVIIQIQQMAGQLEAA